MIRTKNKNQLGNISSRIDMHTHTGNGLSSQVAQHRNTQYRPWSLATVRRAGFCNPVTLTFDFWPLGQCMPNDCYRVSVYQVWCRLQAVYSCSRARTHKQTDRRDWTHTHAGGYTVVGKYSSEDMVQIQCLFIRLSFRFTPAWDKTPKNLWRLMQQCFYANRLLSRLGTRLALTILPARQDNRCHQRNPLKDWAFQQFESANPYPNSSSETRKFP